VHSTNVYFSDVIIAISARLWMRAKGYGLLEAMFNAVVTHLLGDPSNSLSLTVAVQTFGWNYQKQKV